MLESNNTSVLNATFSLQGQVALITGGGSGLGLATAQCMAQAGARVILMGRNEAQLAQAVAAIGQSASFVVHDVTQVDQIPALVSTLASRFGQIDILVNNAGIHVKKPALTTTEQEFNQVLATHVVGAHALTRAVVPAMLERGQGSIVFMASMASLFGIPQVVAYSAAKSAILGMVRTMATEWSGQGVRVNAIAPGWIESNMMLKALADDPVRAEKILVRTPMHCFGEAGDVGWAAVYLCSAAARFITGAVLPVDGGASIGF